jgi:hypothetical protein
MGQDKPTTDIVLLGTATASLSDWVIQGGEYCLVTSAQTFANCPASGGAINAAKLITTPGPPAGATPVYVGPYNGANASNFPDGCVPQPSPAGVNPPATGAAPGGAGIVSFCAVVPTATVNGLAEGSYKLYVHAYETPSTPDAGFNAKPGRWGTYNETDMLPFTVDRTGPTAGSPVIDHNPNNGTIYSAGNLNFLDSLQVTTTIDDSTHGNSIISSAEVFLTNPTVAANPVTVAEYGTGAEMVPAGSQWDSPSKVVYAYIPLAVLTAYPEGKVRYWVHGKDIAGNWGTWSYVDLILDRTAPNLTSATIAGGACTGLNTGCTVSFTATDPVSGGVNSNLVQGEWFTGADPGQGLGFPFGIVPNTTVSGSFHPAAGSGTQIYLRVRDAAGNWSATRAVVAP